MFLSQLSAEVQGGTGAIGIHSHSRCGLSWLPWFHYSVYFFMSRFLVSSYSFFVMMPFS